MSPDHDPLLTLATELADGAEIDWPARLAGLDDADAGVRLQRLSQLLGRLQGDEGDPQGLPGSAPASSWRWGHLQVGELLGSGSFGEVYRAYDPVLRRDVALKLRSRPRASASEGTFLAEARRLARVRHPNVLAVHGADVHGGRAGLWADLIHGRTLEGSLADDSPIARRETLDIAGQLTAALAAVHEAGLVHGDVKASNVMRTTDGRIILMDFGSGSDAPVAARPAAGSPLSMAPELFAGAPATAASDLYGLGVLLFRLLTGRYPVAADSIEALAARHEQGWKPAWGTTNRIPRALRQMVDQLLAREPARRPTARETAQALRAIEEQPRRRRRRLAVSAVLASLLVAVVASTAGWLMARHSAQRAETSRREAEATSEFLTDLLLAPDITRQGPDVKVLDVMDKALALAEDTMADRPLLRGRILWLVGRVKASLGQGDEALGIFGRSETAFGAATEATAARERTEVMIRHARLLVERAELDAAEVLLDDAGRQLEGMAPDPTLRVQWARTDAYLLTQRGQLAEAEARFRDTLDADAGGDPAVLQTLRLELAIVLQKQGKMHAAEEQYRRYLEWSLATQGERHENTLIVRYNLACLVAETGHSAEAESLFRHNVDVARDWLGPGHRLHLLSLTGLSEVVGEQGRYREADDLDGQLLPLATGSWGPDHPRTQILKANIAARKLRAGDVVGAEALLRPAIDALDGALGADASATLHARMTWIELLLETGRTTTAARVAADAHRRAVASLGSDSPVTLGLAVRLGRASVVLGRVEEGLPLLHDALLRQRQVLGDEHRETLSTQVALARAEAEAGHSEAARRLLCDAAPRLSRTLGAEDPVSLEVQSGIAAIGGCS